MGDGGEGGAGRLAGACREPGQADFAGSCIRWTSWPTTSWGRQQRMNDHRLPPSPPHNTHQAQVAQGEVLQRAVSLLLTCRLLLTLCAPHLLTLRSHFEKQSKKLQSSSPVQFCSRISLILGSKKAMSTSIATTCNQTAQGN